MAAGRPRKPDEMKILDGTWRADRDGDPSADVVADGEPVPPSFLKGEALRFWREVVPGLVASGIAKARDSYQLAELCTWWARHRRLSRMIDTAKNADKRLHSLILMAGIAWMNFDKIAVRFGLTPSDRAKLRLPAARSGKPGIMTRKRNG